jgi:hypothetical protein
MNPFQGRFESAPQVPSLPAHNNLFLRARIERGSFEITVTIADRKTYLGEETNDILWEVLPHSKSGPG